MSEPFLSEIRIVGFNFAPRGWAYCDGQLLPINQNQSLYSLLGTTFGGDGITSFALPDMRGRVPVHPSSSVTLGARGGEETVALTQQHLPAHAHTRPVSTANATDVQATGTNVLASTPGTLTYGAAHDPVDIGQGEVQPLGNGQAHNNMQPFMTLNFCIALQGLFPSRN